MTPQEIYLGVKHGILTPDFGERNYFWYTGQLILRKIIKIVATSCQILRLKCTKFDFAYSAPPNLLAGFMGPPRNVALMVLSPQSKNSSLPYSQQGRTFSHFYGIRQKGIGISNITNSIMIIAYKYCRVSITPVSMKS